jgi:hypothetical protein
MARKPTLEREIRDLYRLPLGEFTAARNALAARLKKAGDRDEAASVAALAKPSPAAWAITQLLAREPDRLSELLAAGKEARAAQRQAMAGRGAEAFRAALERARALVDELRGAAEEILQELGRAPSAAVVERLTADLQALAFLSGAAETIRRGYLAQDLEAPGFEVLAGLQLAAAPRPLARGARPAQKGRAASKAAPPPAKTSRPGRREPVPKAVADGRRRWEEAVRARRDREVAQAKERVESAESEVARAEAEAAFRRAAAKQAERAAAEAGKQAKAARDAADAASARAERARADLARAREALTAASRGHRPGPARRSS